MPVASPTPRPMPSNSAGPHRVGGLITSGAGTVPGSLASSCIAHFPRNLASRNCAPADLTERQRGSVGAASQSFGTVYAYFFRAQSGEHDPMPEPNPTDKVS